MTYVILINIIGIILMYIDKYKSIKNKYRISENTLFLITFIGGGIGTTVGMYLFRHKTKKLKFKYGLPLITLIIYLIGGLI